MRRSSRLALGVGSLAVLVLSAMGQPTSGGFEQRFRQFDRNGDGKLTPQGLPGQWFGRLDTNGDGVVTLEEARAPLAGGAGRRPGQGQQPPGVVAPARPSALGEWAAVFDLCVRDVEAASLFRGERGPQIRSNRDDGV